MLTIIIFTVIGFAAGAVCVFVALDRMRRALSKDQSDMAAQAGKLQEKAEEVKALSDQVELQRKAALSEEQSLAAKQREFDQRVIGYGDLAKENALLKRDLRNIMLNCRNLQFDRDGQRETQAALDTRSQELGLRYLKDNVKWITASISHNNFASCKQKLLDVIAKCREIGLVIPPEREQTLLAELRAEFERAVRAQLEREEQARIKAQIREEQLREREIQRVIEQANRERQIIAEALERALAIATDQHSVEIERLRQQLAEADQRSQRAISQAQLTKSGYIYVISNIGSFGKDVYKVGMTRRLEPMDRIRELGDASVPFRFDVHMMISSDNAPALECALHRGLHKCRINKVNPRKEYFRAPLEAIVEIVKANHGDVEYRVDPEALEYNQSLTISDEDQDYIEQVFDEEDQHPDLAAVDE
jgi:hypothetical protein